MISGKAAEIRGKTTYEKWVESQEIPVIRDFYIEDIRKVVLKPWKRKGGLGAYLNLIGTEESTDGYICEIPPGGSLKPQRHLFEEMVYVVQGRGATAVWLEEGKKQTFEWQTGSLFSPPLNTWHQHFNGSGAEPARYLAVTNAPFIINLFHNLDFILNNPFEFTDRFSADPDYFSGKGKSYPGRIWDTNLLPDVKAIPLEAWKERGSGGQRRIELSENTMAAHISEFPVATYKKAHRHGPGAHVVIVSGKGYSLLWPEGSPIRRFEWHENSIIVPPGNWYHQHFNTGKTSARYLGLRWGSQKFRMRASTSAHEQNDMAWGVQIEHDDEDPMIRQMFEEELKKEGVPRSMDFPGGG